MASDSSAPLLDGFLLFFGSASRGSSWQRWPIFLLMHLVQGLSCGRRQQCGTGKRIHGSFTPRDGSPNDALLYLQDRKSCAARPQREEIDCQQNTFIAIAFDATFGDGLRILTDLRQYTHAASAHSMLAYAVRGDCMNGGKREKAPMP